MIDENIKKLMRIHDNLDWRLDVVPNFFVKVVHLIATTLHLLHTMKDGCVASTSGYYKFIVAIFGRWLASCIIEKAQ